jgi:hypothetical protein
MRQFYVEVIQKEIQEAVPKFIQNFALQRMKYYGVDKRYLPPQLKQPTRTGQVKGELHGIDF